MKIYGIKTTLINGVPVYVVNLRMRATNSLVLLLAKNQIPYDSGAYKGKSYIYVSQVTTNQRIHDSLLVFLGPVLKKHAINQVKKKYEWVNKSLCH